MKYRFTLTVAGMFGAALLFAPMVTNAGTAELLSGGDTLTPLDGVQPPNEDVAVVGYSSDDPIGTSYDLVFEVSEKPAVVVVLGDMEEVAGWTFDDDTNQLSVSVLSADFGDIDIFEDLPEEQAPESILFLGIAFPVADGEDGPPVEATGMYMATNVMEWQMNPESGPGAGFGFTLTGPAGHEGFFKFFVPNSLIEWMDVAREDLVLFENDDQAVIESTELDDGILFNISITFQDNAVNASSVIGAAASSDVTKIFTAKEALPVSIAANKTSVKKGQDVRLYGWLKSGKKSKKVVLQQKVGKKKWQKVKSLTTSKNGYYTTMVAVDKKTKFRFRTRTKSGSVRKSPAKTVNVS